MRLAKDLDIEDADWISELEMELDVSKNMWDLAKHC